MMSVKEYAIDINKDVKEVIEKAIILGFDIESEEDLLDDYMITELDIAISNEANVDDVIEEEIELEETYKEEKKGKKIPPKKEVKQDLKKEIKEMYKSKEKLVSNIQEDDKNAVFYKEGMTIGDFAKELNVNASEIIKKLFLLGVVTNVNSQITYESAEILALDYKKELKKEESRDITNFEEYEIIDKEEDLVKRAPVVTIMGHVDHGKTTLLDAIRDSDVAGGEAGGITQAISAYQVNYNGSKITFFDTPGHAAFSEMRSRGAQITDIVIIIVAADDGVMTQTKEAIEHAKLANVPIIVAINKIDKPNINIEKIKSDLTELGLAPEEWGGTTLYNKISAKTKQGINELLENILLIAELHDYKANPKRYATGTVVEARLDKSMGAVSTVLIQNGTLRMGDPIVVGSYYGRIRTLENDKGKKITEAGPSMPVSITGINGVPEAGDKFMAFETEKQARSIGEKRAKEARIKNITPEALSLDDLFNKIQDGAKEVNVVVKADVQGSAEAVKNSLEKIDVEGVKVKVIRSGVGAITESDIILAKAGNAIIVGFNVRPNNIIKDRAKEEGVEIRLYNIIYKAVEEMTDAMKGMLDPEFEEKILGTIEVRQLFKFSKVGVIAGSMVLDGLIKNNSKARIIRDGVVIYDGKIGSLQREKDSVKEVKKGYECGVTIDGYNDIKPKDIIEAYEMVEVARK
jgi:translation initiation factor IF-2